jgi:site-specific DNA recombinase
VIEQVPHLRMIDQGLWDIVAARLAATRSTPAVTKRIKTRFWEHRRPKHFTTGLITCGGCGKLMAVIGKDYLGCNYARRRSTCSNRAAVRRSEVERLVLDGLKTQLMAPDLVKEFIQAFHQEVNRRRGNEAAERQARERELPAVNEKIRRLVDAIANGVRTPAIVQALEAAEARKIILELEAGSPPPSPVRLLPSLAELYRQRVADLHVALADASLRSHATEIIRSLIDRIVVTSEPKGLEIDLVGDLAGMVAVAQGQDSKTKKPPLWGRLCLLPKSVR